MSYPTQDQRTSSVGLRKEIALIGKHSMIYAMGHVVSRAIGFIMIPVYTRYIAPTNYGAMELIEILVAAAALISSVGLAEAMGRFYYGETEQEKRNEICSTIVIGLSAIGFCFILLFVSLSSYLSHILGEGPEYGYYLQVAMAGLWGSMLCEIGYSYLRIRYMARFFVTVTLLHLVVALALNIWFVVYLKLDILGVLYSTFICQTLTGIILATVIFQKVGLRFSRAVLWRLVRFGLPLVPARIGLMLGFVSNRFFLRWYASPDPAIALAQIGLYSLGHKFAVVINRFVNSPFNAFWEPRRIELLLTSGSEAKATVARVCTYATMISIFSALLLCSGIESVIEIMADPSYKGAHVVVPFVALAYVALGLEKHFTAGIICRKMTKWAAYASVPSLGLVLLWNYVFIPRYGLLGAATSNLAGFSLRLAIIYVVSQRLFPIPFEIIRLLKLFLVAVFLYALSQTIQFDSPYLTFIGRALIGMTFPLALLAVKFYHPSELETIRSGLRNGWFFFTGFFPRFQRP